MKIYAGRAHKTIADVARFLHPKNLTISSGAAWGAILGLTSGIAVNYSSNNALPQNYVIPYLMLGTGLCAGSFALACWLADSLERRLGRT